MCKISSGLRARYCALLLGVAVLALVGTAPTPAAGQQSPSPQVSGSCAGSIGVTFNTATPVFSTEDVNLTLTLTSSVAGGATTNTESVPSLGVDLACSSGSSFGSVGCSTEPTGNPIVWPAHLVTTTCTDRTSAPVTWSGPAAGTAGPITLTPNNPVFFSGNGQSCRVTFDVEVASGAAGQTIEQAEGWSGTCDIDGTTVRGSAAGSDFFDVASCGVSIVKNLSCDGGASFNNNCTGSSGDPLQVEYTVTNTASGGTAVALNNCFVHDVTGQTAMTSGGTEFVSDTTVGSLAVGGNTTTTAITTDSTGTALACSADGPNFDTAEVDCTCGDTSFHVDASSTANYSCETCSVSVDKQVTCQGTTYEVSCTGPDTPPGCDTIGPAAPTSCKAPPASRSTRSEATGASRALEEHVPPGQRSPQPKTLGSATWSPIRGRIR